MYHLIPSAGLSQPIPDRRDLERTHVPNLLHEDRERCGFPATQVRLPPDAQSASHADAASMRRRSYAVYWNEGDGPRHAGKLELGPLHALLSGNSSGRLALPLDEIDEVDYARGRLRISRRGASTVTIGSLDAPGALLELASHLST